MIQLNYTKNAVLAMFMQAIGNLNPSAADIQRFDNDLHSANENLLVTEMNAQGLDPRDIDAKSQVLLYSQNAPGSSAGEQIKAACLFFKNTKIL